MKTFIRTTAAFVFLMLVLGAPRAAHAQRIKLPMKLPELEKLAKENPYDAASQYNVALGYWSTKNYDAAEASLKKAVELDPRFAAAHLGLAYLPYARRPQLWREIGTEKLPAESQPVVQEMDRRYRQAFLVDPFVDLRITGAVEPPKSGLIVGDPFLSALYEILYQGFDDFRGGDYTSAYRRFNNLLKIWADAGRTSLDSIPGEILWYRGLAANQLGRPDEAVHDIGELLRRAEKEEKSAKLVMVPLRTNEYRYVLGSILQKKGDLNGAAEMFKAATEGDLGLYMAHVQLANVYEMAGRLDIAQLERKRAVDANPDDHTSMIEMAETQVKAKKLDDARKTLEDVVATEPNNIRALYTLGVVDAMLGDKPAAIQRFEAFLKVVPARFSGEIDDVRKRIAALR
jgi:tetratricopeptide (TPR) repeat protein